MTAARPSAGLVDVVVIARDDEATIGGVVAAVPRRGVRSLVVVDRGSRDRTSEIAGDAGAIVVRAGGGGYGAACRRALDHLTALPIPPDVVVFLGADGGDDPAELPRLLAPIQDGNVELVIGVDGARRAPEARATLGLIGLVYRRRFRDLGGFRAIRFPALVALGLRDRGAGWDVEMQVRALALGLQVVEVEVAGGAGRARPGARARLDAAARGLFHIVRHATTR